MQDDTWYIIEAIDPGPKSIFEVAYFEYDQKYTQHLINKIANLYDKQLTLIGLWHRHPGSFDQFSSTDDGTNFKYASMRNEGAISALVNIDPNFRITLYHVACPCRYKKIEYDVGDSLIPDDLLKFKTQECFGTIMKNLLGSSNRTRNINDGYHKSVSLESFMKFILSQLKDHECAEIQISESPVNEENQEDLIDEIVDDLTFMAETLNIETAILLENNYLTVYQETIDKTTKLYFMLIVDDESIMLSYDNKCYKYQRGLFTEAYGRSKAEREKDSGIKIKARKQFGVVDSVIKIIRFNRNED